MLIAGYLRSCCWPILPAHYPPLPPVPATAACCLCLPAGLMDALASLLLDCSKSDLAAFIADLGTAEAALRCAVAAGTVAARGDAAQRTALWGDLLPAAFKAIRKLGG